jgi:acetyl-CoA C-acetyltransferase
MTKSAYIIAAHRSAVIPKGGAFSHLGIHQLAAPVIAHCLQSANINADRVCELVLSNAVGAGGNPARLSALAADLPEHIGGLSIDRQCTGGLDAIWLAAQMVTSGVHDIIIAGGSESASRRPIRMHRAPNGAPIPYDRPDFTGLRGRDPEMVDAVAQLAQEMGIDGQSQTDWAINSHAKAMQADLSNEITPIEHQTRDAFTRKLSQKTCDRAPILSGTISTATTAVDADAAAFVIVVNEAIAKNHPSAIRIKTGAMLGGQPDQPALAPIAAIQSVLDTAGITAQSLSAVEIMEAYAAQAIIAAKSQSFDPATINKAGGALSRGHPIGASGAILGVRLYHELQKSGGTGLATIAAAGGLGSALLLQA